MGDYKHFVSKRIAFSISAFTSFKAQAIFLLFFAFLCYTLWTHFNFSAFGSIEVGTSALSSLTSIVSVQVNGITLAVAAIFHKVYDKKVFNSGALVAAIFLSAAGTLMAATTGLLLIQSSAISILAGVLSGIGSTAMFFVLVAVVTQNEQYLLPLLLGFLLANVVSVPLRLLPAFALLIVIALMPAASILLALKARESDEIPNSCRNYSDCAKNVRPIAPLMIEVMIFIFFGYAINAIMTAFSNRAGFDPNPISLIVITCFIIVLFVLSCYTEDKKPNLVSLYRMVFLFLLLVIFSVPFFAGNFSIAYSINSVSSTLLRAFFVLIELRICVKTGLSPVFVFGIGEALKKLPNLVVNIWWPWYSLEEVLGNPTEHIHFFIIAALLLVIIYLLVFTERNLVQLSKSDEEVEVQNQIDSERLAVAKKYRLTDRETEVFLFLCEGRSAPWIAKEIFVSQSTVNVHVKNIYKKCDVHSRQELLDLVAHTANIKI